jgi:uncharacterized glyoxalase superfamily protein PhnB
MSAHTQKPNPEGYPTLSPYLIVDGADALIAFLKRALGGELVRRHGLPSGKVSHSEVRLGDSLLMIADAPPGMQPIPAALHVYVHDVDAAYQRALEAGATSQSAPETKMYGDRNCGVVDPSGCTWYLSMRVEEVSDEEIEQRAKAANYGQSG